MSAPAELVRRGVARQRRGESVDALLTRAVGRSGTCFDRLRRYKRIADAICAELTEAELLMPKSANLPDSDRVCACGEVFDSYRALRIHQGKACVHYSPDPRMAEALRRYTHPDREPVLEIVRDLRISPPTLYQWLRRAGIPKRSGRSS